MKQMKQITKINLTLCFCLVLLSGCGNQSKIGIYTIQNSWKIDKQLQLQGNQLVCGLIGEETTEQDWVLEQIYNSDVYRIKSKSNPKMYLHIENGKLECGEIENGWNSAQWAIVNYGSSVKIQSAWKINQYLNIEHEELVCSPIKNGWSSADWKLIKKSF